MKNVITYELKEPWNGPRLIRLRRQWHSSIFHGILWRWQNGFHYRRILDTGKVDNVLLLYHNRNECQIHHHNYCHLDRDLKNNTSNWSTIPQLQTKQARAFLSQNNTWDNKEHKSCRSHHFCFFSKKIKTLIKNKEGDDPRKRDAITLWRSYVIAIR